MTIYGTGERLGTSANFQKTFLEIGMPFYLNVAKVLFRDRCVIYIPIYTIGPTTAANDGHFNITIHFSSFEADVTHINIYEEKIAPVEV